MKVDKGLIALYLVELQAARELVSTPEKWCKYTFAHKACGTAIDYRHADACVFCVVGALSRVSFDRTHRKNITKIHLTYSAYDILWRLFYKILQGSISDWNDADTTTHADVLRVFDEIIAYLENPETSPHKGRFDNIRYD